MSLRVRDPPRAVGRLEVQVEIVVPLATAPSPGSRLSKCAPIAWSIAMRAGPSLTQRSTTRSWLSPAPATSVSCVCASNESPAASTAAMPPCAYLVFDSSRERFVTSTTSPCVAASRANDRPAMPLPMTSVSHVMGMKRRPYHFSPAPLRRLPMLGEWSILRRLPFGHHMCREIEEILRSVRACAG